MSSMLGIDSCAHAQARTPTSSHVDGYIRISSFYRPGPKQLLLCGSFGEVHTARGKLTLAAQDVYSANVRLVHSPELPSQLATLFRHRLRGRQAGKVATGQASVRLRDVDWSGGGEGG